jgi:hypothetical protein
VTHFNVEVPFTVETIYRSFCRGLLLGVTVTAVLVAAGCGGGADGTYPVRGTVYLDGQPAKELAGGTVVFNSTELHKSASGEIQTDGTYRLGSLKKDDGAFPGKYQVAVSPPEASEAGERTRRRPATKPSAFEEPKDLEVTVERRTNDIPIQLQRAKTVRR